MAHPKGEKHQSSKLTEADVQEIFKQFQAGRKVSQIAFSFGVSRAQISRIIRGEQWGHLARPWVDSQSNP